MASEKLGSVPAQQIHNGLNQHPQLVFPEAYGCGPLQPHRRTAGGTESVGKAATRELTASFLDHHHFFHPQPPSQAAEFRRQWNVNGRDSGGGASDDDGEDEEDDEEDEDDDDEEDDNNMDNVVTVAKNSAGNQDERYSGDSNSQKMKRISALGIKEGNVGQSVNESNNENNSSGEVRNGRGGEMYYVQYLNGGEGPSSSSGQKDVVENGCSFSGRKEVSCLAESGDSLRAILSDPLTGILMDDAMILPCGHSFGSGGIQQITRIKACSTCSQPVSEDSIAPNLSLRLAVQAFRREEELQANRTMKRRRERYDRDKETYGDSILSDPSRVKGVQFPFSVTDRVIIKGNKRTPQRFVGREAIVTTQCLNGWYVVKTLDNAESVKLQYRSLAKVTEPSPMKTIPNWL